MLLVTSTSHHYYFKFIDNVCEDHLHTNLYGQIRYLLTDQLTLVTLFSCNFKLTKIFTLNSYEITSFSSFVI